MFKMIKLILSLIILSQSFCSVPSRVALDAREPAGLIYQLLPFFFPSLKPSSAKEMKAYFLPLTGSSAIISGTKMSLIVPYSADLSSLSAEFYHTGVSSRINGIEQISGQTLNSYSQALTYTITAANATQKTYTLNTTKGSPDSNTLLGFQFDSLLVHGVISGTSVILNVPYGTDLKNLIPTFSHNGSKLYSNNIEQVSGKTANDFTNPLFYEVQAENGSRKQYTTVVVGGTLTSNTIQSISVDGINGTITGDGIYFNFAPGQNISSVSPIISHLGASVTVNGLPFLNGETTLDLTQPQRVKITSADGTVKEYTIYSGYIVATGTGTTIGTGTGTGSGTGSGTTTGTGTGTTTGTGVAPSSLTYTGSPYTFIQNAVVPTQTPTVTGTVTNCIASPSLPTGLILDATTCAISGTPTVTQATTSYAIIASNASGNTAAIVSITVNIPPPSALTYTGNPFSFMDNITITPQIPTVTGTVVSCTVSPALPSGLTLNSTTCRISGTPTIAQVATNYTITAGNISGNTTAIISITVMAPAFSWAQEAFLKAPNAGTDDYFGKSVFISEDTIAVGAVWESSSQTTITNGTTASADNSAFRSGAAYVFKRTGTIWAQEAYLKASNANSGDQTNSAGLSISSDTIAWGVPQEDSNQTTITNGTTASADNSIATAGAVYVFKR